MHGPDRRPARAGSRGSTGSDSSASTAKAWAVKPSPKAFLERLLAARLIQGNRARLQIFYEGLADVYDRLGRPAEAEQARRSGAQA